jgi:hypothetical protein
MRDSTVSIWPASPTLPFHFPGGLWDLPQILTDGAGNDKGLNYGDSLQSPAYWGM